MSEQRFRAGPYLRQLKDFQKRTVDHAFHRLFRAERRSRRFLVADEVGLGKTLVARGVVAKAIEHLQDRVERIDVVYVCSNAAIARQNINRLNVLGEPQTARATRLTLLPVELTDLGSRRINFVSFTPGTTFNLKSAGGRREERELLFHILRDGTPLPANGLGNLLRLGVGRERWRARLKRRPAYDPRSAETFLQQLRGDRERYAELEALCGLFHRDRERWPRELRERRNAVVGALRRHLAKACVEQLEPDLIILDEFQRFKELLDPETDAGELAHELMRYQDAHVLLLSATPYRMLTLYGEDEADHYADFLETLRFLYGDDARVERIRADLGHYRRALYAPDGDPRPIRDRLRERLMCVMCRTERVPDTRERDAMVSEPAVPARLEPAEIRAAAALDRLVRTTGAADAVDYWKSAPFLVNFMKGYDLKERVRAAEGRNPLVAEALAAMGEHLLDRGDLARYRQIDPGNARLRALVERTLGREEWRHLWMPPSLPYSQPSRQLRESAPATKSLVFSSWNVVPDVIAAVVSYTAERERVLAQGPTDYFSLTESRRALLTLRMRAGHPERMSTLIPLMPAPFLAAHVDPLAIALEHAPQTMTTEQLLQDAETRLRPALERMPRGAVRDDHREDPAWYWAALARLPQDERFRRWLDAGEGLHDALGDSADEGASVLDHHLALFARAFDQGHPLGPQPQELTRVLAEVAIGSPAVCALRALRRVAPDISVHEPALLSAAARIAEGFRSLFNSPDVRSFLETNERPYWREVLRYCADANLQAMLDEYVHVLRDSLGLFDSSPAETVGEIADALHAVLGIRSSDLAVDAVETDGRKRFRLERFKVRCKYALRFGDMKDDSNAVLHRASVVRDAFNSPFRPFVLASTSIGQEGLDFHGYCHRVWHWNLPHNPVDLEQREGRVNRYKGHAVRKNVAAAIGLRGLKRVSAAAADPWDALFACAREQLQASGKHQSDLQPYWIFDEVDDPHRVGRIAPVLPFSIEQGRFRNLKQTLAVYRLAFGQPRQQDLLDYLREHVDAADAAQEGQLNLKP